MRVEFIQMVSQPNRAGIRSDQRREEILCGENRGPLLK